MMEFLIPIIPAFAMLSFAIIVKAVIDNLIKLKIANKDNPRTKPDTNTRKRKVHPYVNLKWGFLLSGIGLALLIKEFILTFLSSGGTFGLMFLL